ncbi:hypothetical protein GCM10027570_28640 [Streptomonospora sediminis]
MKPRPLLLRAAAVAALLTPAVAAPQLAAQPAGQVAHAAVHRAPGGQPGTQRSGTHLENTFERPAAGSTYPLSEWRADGWYAPRSRGLGERTLVDGATPAHSGDHSLRVLYPEGGIGVAESGAWAPFELDKAREYHLSMWVRFGADFSWGSGKYGGKIGIGLAGGGACSGGRTCDGTNGFTSRFIWRRADGAAALYYYHMDKKGTYGDYVMLKQGGADGPAINWPRGEWVNVVQRVKTNTVTGGRANADGEIEAFYNGRSVAEVTGLRFVTNNDQVDKAYFSSFAGGSSPEYAPRHDSHIWYDDIKVSTDPADICELGNSCR